MLDLYPQTKPLETSCRDYYMNPKEAAWSGPIKPPRLLEGRVVRAGRAGRRW
jgi:hypothetical protein